VAAVVFPTPVGEGNPHELELSAAGLTIRGTSIAARATAFAVPELGVALDVGRMSPAIAAQPVVLLSHGHLDHLSGVLAYLNVRARFYTGEPTRLVAPAGVAEPLTQALAVFPGMESVRKRLRLERAIVAARPGDVVELPGGRARAFAVDHGVPALGWALLRPRRRRAALVYAADGSTAPFAADPGLLDAEVAVVECTFLEPNRRVAARLAKHAHLKDWLEVAPSLRCDRLVLAHLPPMPRADLRALTLPLADRLAGTLVLWAA
jgi:ribonuclease BN (tRNA processing enzyme)